MSQNSIPAYRLKYHAPGGRDEPPQAPVYFEAVGRIISEWGRYETIWMECMRIMLSGVHPNQKSGILSKPIHASFKSRCDFWSALFLTDRFSGNRDFAIDLMRRSKEPYKLRSIFAHSLFNGFTSMDPPVASYVNHQQKREEVIQSNYEIALPDMVDVLNALGGIHLGIVPLMFDAVAAQPEQPRA